MSSFEEKVQWQPRFGIARAHWDALRDYAASRALFIYVRGGKEASIPWIERGFPGKPLALKAKVDPTLGLLVARDAHDRAQAHDAGHFVVTRGGAGLQLAGARTTTSLPSGPMMAVWAREGVVVDGARRMPFTSDYDLAAVLPVDFAYGRDLGQRQVDGSVTSPWAEQLRRDLNRAFGSERFRHGPQAQYDQRLANAADKSEWIVAFAPARDVYASATPLGVGEQTMQFRDLLRALYPAKAHQFSH